MAALDLRTEEKNEALIIKFPGVVDINSKDDLEKNIKMWQIKELKLFVLDFKETIDFDRNLYKMIIDFKKNLEKVGKSLATISVSNRLKNNITAEGMASAFNIVLTLNDAYKLAGIKLVPPKKIKLDTAFINPFITGTISTFETQVGLKITPSKPSVKKPGDKLEDISLAGVINLTCSYFSGTISIAFSEKVFLKIYNKMLDEKIEAIDDSVKDGAGELLNIIYGQAKKELNRVGYQLEKAIPTILAGENIQIHTSKQTPSILLPFESELGVFYLEVCVSID
jgi:chemotaxis protein CheX